jgi:hypothetical protein
MGSPAVGKVVFDPRAVLVHSDLDDHLVGSRDGKDFLEAGKKQMAADTIREATWFFTLEILFMVASVIQVECRRSASPRLPTRLCRRGCREWW